MDIGSFNFFDGEYEIIFSNNFIVYDNHLKIENVEDFEINFYFIKDTGLKKSDISIKGDDENHMLNVTLKNFDNTLGAGVTRRVPILNLNSGKTLYFGLYSNGLTANTDLLNISLTFYIK